MEAENEKKFSSRLKETPKISATTVSKPKRERAWKGLGLKQLNDDGTVTRVTDVTLPGVFYPQTNSENQNIEQGEIPVTSVTAVTNQRECGQCSKFRTGECSFPHGPGSPGVHCDYAVKCVDFSGPKTERDQSEDYPEPGENC